MKAKLEPIRGVVDLLAGVAMIAASFVVITGSVPWGPSGNQQVRVSQPELELPSTPVSLDGAHVIGSNNAQMVLIEYADFQCPYCARMAVGALAELIRDYVEPGRVRLAFRHVALERIHPLAVQAAVAAECAGAQGKFWPMHDLLFADPSRLDAGSLEARANVLGLNRDEFVRCTADPSIAQIVRRETEESASIGIVSTPTVVLGQMQSEGTVSLLSGFSGSGRAQEIRASLDALLEDVRR